MSVEQPPRATFGMIYIGRKCGGKISDGLDSVTNKAYAYITRGKKYRTLGRELSIEN